MTLEEIVSKIKEADAAYYTDGTSALSDYEYDQLKSALASIDPGNALLQSLGEDHTEGLKVVTRSVRMLSLEKIQQNKADPTNLMEVAKWASKFENQINLVNTDPHDTGYLLEPKVDGMSAEAKYVHGVLTTVSTRGKGDSGDDITATTKQCFPEQILAWRNYEEVNIRGELYISKEEFTRINEEQEKNGLPLFANARNLCAGTVKSKTVIPDRKVEFVAHGLGFVSEPKLFRSFLHLYMDLALWGIHTVIPSWSNTSDDVLRHVLQYQNATLPYCIDGVVIKLNNLGVYSEAGSTEHHPKGAVAFKFMPEVKQTTVKSIIWQLGGKTGKATPVAVVEPVNLSGSIVTRVSLANAGLMALQGVREGVTIKLEKANEIIPHVVEVLDGVSYELEEEITCPSCGAKMQLVQGKTPHTADYFCVNENCHARKTSSLQQSLGIHGLNILGIGPEICSLFVEKYPNLNAATFVQLNADDYPESMSELQRSNLYKEAREGRKAPLWRWIAAMMIAGVGEVSAKRITRSCKNLREFIRNINDTNFPIDITDKRRAACVDYLNTKGNVAQELLEMSLNPESDNYISTSDNLPLTGKSFVVTGIFAYGRKAIEDMIPRFGGTLKSSVSKKVDYVVCGSDPGATKISRASALEIPVITEAELFKLISN